MKRKWTYWNSCFMAIAGFAAADRFTDSILIILATSTFAALIYLLLATLYWRHKAKEIIGSPDLKEFEWFMSIDSIHEYMSPDKLREAYIEEKNKRKRF